MVGDSIMAYGDDVGAGGSGIGETSQSYVAWAGSQLKGTPFRVIANRAVGGTLIDSGANSVIYVQVPLALVDQSDILWIHIGINHLNPTIDTNLPTVAQIVQKFQHLLDFVSPQKPCIIIDSLNPLDSTAASPSGAMPRRSDIPLVNAGLKALCAGYRNVIYNDTYDAIAADQSGNALLGLLSPVDGIHQLTAGAYFLGVQSAANVYPRVALAPAFRQVKNVALPDFSGTAGTATPGSGTINGQIASNLTLVITAGTGVVTASVANNQQTLAINNSAGGAVCTVQLKLTSQTAYLGTLANGDIVTAFGRMIVTGANALNRCNLIFQQNPAGTAVNIDSLSKSTQENGTPPTTFPSVNYDGTFNTRPYTINAALASINLALTIEVQAGKSVTVTTGGWGYAAVLPE